MTRVSAPPHASMLIESMRDVGYTLETALADVVDNAIAAGATAIQIFSDPGEREPRIAILDNGRGIDAAELLDAMRLGNQSPLNLREPTDLGRFGLGLKTASFSQCRRMTVVTKQRGAAAAATWDLDQVAEADDWLVDVPGEPLAVPYADRLGASGTLVLWERLDRLSGVDSTEAGTRLLVRRLSDGRSHLELVFHRFLSGGPGRKGLEISLNGRPLEPFDPFHSDHAATIQGPVDVVRVEGYRVTIQAFTLPHHKKVTPEAWERFAGPEGYVKSQGFYLYRANRLIIHGTWFGLARQAELTKLARVCIDMPNGLDAEWKVDIRKASAQPPPQVRERLRRLIETIGATSKRVYTARGQKLASDDPIPVWVRQQNKNEIRYLVNPDHPVLTALLDRLPEGLQRDLFGVIEMIGAAIPVDTLFADIGGTPNQVAGKAMSNAGLESVVTATYRQLREAGISHADVLTMLHATEPFISNWPLTEGLVAQAEGGDGQDV